MLRKLFTAVTAIAIALTGLSQVAPASADGQFSATATMDYQRDVSAVIPVSDQSAVMIWRNYASDGSLHAGRINLDGTLDQDTTLDPAGSGVSLGMRSKGAWAVLADGTIAVTWTRVKHTNDLFTSENLVAFSSDGIQWSQPVSPFETLNYSLNDCDFMFQCGYREAQISGDGLGNMAIATLVGDGSSYKYVIRTSANGVAWSSATNFSPVSNGLSPLGIAGLPTGGFISGWSEWNGSNSTVYGVRTASSTNSSWTRPTVIEASTDYVNNVIFVQTSPISVGLVFASELSNESSTVYLKNFNAVTKTWETKVTLQTLSRAFAGWGNMIGSYSNGRAAVLYSLGIYGEGTSKVYLTEVQAGSAPTTKLVETSNSQDTSPLLVSPRADGSTYVGWAGQGIHPFMATVKAGNVSTPISIPNGFERAYGQAAVSPSGNIFFEFDHFNPAEVRVTMAYRGAEQPVIASNPAIRGISAVGKKLTIKVPAFLSPSGVGTTTLQWLSCSAPIAGIQSTVPVTCAPISKATTATFKVSGKQKKKYLALAITNINAVGTTTVVTKTTGKTK